MAPSRLWATPWILPWVSDSRPLTWNLASVMSSQLGVAYMAVPVPGRSYSWPLLLLEAPGSWPSLSRWVQITGAVGLICALKWRGDWAHAGRS